MNEAQIIYVMGVSGSGKSTVGKLLSERLDYPFFDGDDYHPASNVAKMSRGEALNDADRKSWLERLNIIAVDHQEKGAVLVCSALKEKYRIQLVKNLNEKCRFLYLKGSLETINERLSKRKGHYMPKALLQSQFDTLEEPKDAIAISILKTPDVIVDEYIKRVSS